MGNNYTSALGVSGGGVQPTGDAVEANVLAGKTFSNASGVGKTGTMVNNGAVSGTATPSQPYTIPAGYHNGSGVVTASGSGNPVTDLADNSYTEFTLGSITSGQIVSGTANTFGVSIVIANIKDFNTAATSGQAISYNTRVSTDGTTWVTPETGTNNIANYDYAMIQFTDPSYSITFTS